MKLWTFDPVTNLTVPYLWQLDEIKGPSDNVSLYSTTVADRSAVGLYVYRSNQNSSSVWTTIHVRQDLKGQALNVAFNSRISLWVFPTFTYWYDLQSKNPENAYGIEINDGVNLVWYVFADEPNQTFQLPHHRIVVQQTQLNTWSYRSINIAREYQLAGWPEPESLSFILIVGTTRIHPGTWVGYFAGINVQTAPSHAQSLPNSTVLSLFLGDGVAILVLTSVTILKQRLDRRDIP
jgi:hypothetical protein